MTDGLGEALADRRRRKSCDPLVRYMIFHWVLGALGGALAATALLIFDPFGIWPLIHDSGLGLQAIFLLYVGFMTTVGGLVCAAAVMYPPKDDDPPRGGLRGNGDAGRLEAEARLRRGCAAGVSYPPAVAAQVRSARPGLEPAPARPRQ